MLLIRQGKNFPSQCFVTSSIASIQTISIRNLATKTNIVNDNKSSQTKQIESIKPIKPIKPTKPTKTTKSTEKTTSKISKQHVDDILSPMIPSPKDHRSSELTHETARVIDGKEAFPGIDPNSSLAKAKVLDISPSNLFLNPRIIDAARTLALYDISRQEIIKNSDGKEYKLSEILDDQQVEQLEKAKTTNFEGFFEQTKQYYKEEILSKQREHAAKFQFIPKIPKQDYTFVDNLFDFMKKKKLIKRNRVRAPFNPRFTQLYNELIDEIVGLHNWREQYALEQGDSDTKDVQSTPIVQEKYRDIERILIQQEKNLWKEVEKNLQQKRKLINQQEKLLKKEIEKQHQESIKKYDKEQQQLLHKSNSSEVTKKTKPIKSHVIEIPENIVVTTEPKATSTKKIPDSNLNTNSEMNSKPSSKTNSKTNTIPKSNSKDNSPKITATNKPQETSIKPTKESKKKISTNPQIQEPIILPSHKELKSEEILETKSSKKKTMKK